MKRFFKISLIIVGVFVVIGGIIYGVIMYASSSARSVASDFIILSSSGQNDQANVMLHQSLQTDEAIQKVAEIFDGVDPYTDVSFTSVAMEGGSTTLGGTARTAGGCASNVEFELIENQIIYFNINPLCR